jgi:hypothetical protein
LTVLCSAQRQHQGPSIDITAWMSSLLQSLASKVWQHESSFVYLGVIVSEQLLLLLWGESAQRLADIAVGVLAADHEADLTGGVGGDGCVGVLDGGKDFLAVLLELSDKRHVEPLVLGYDAVSMIVSSSSLSQNHGND